MNDLLKLAIETADGVLIAERQGPRGPLRRDPVPGPVSVAIDITNVAFS